MVDGWMGDDWFHNGAFRNHSLDYALEMSLDKGAAGTTPPTGVGDQYTRYLHAGSSGDFVRPWGLEAVPFVPTLLTNPASSAFGSLQAGDKLVAESERRRGGEECVKTVKSRGAA